MERHTQAADVPAEIDTYMDMVPWVNAYLKLRHKLVVEGTEHIPEGPAMFVANHLAFDDSLAIAAVYANTQNKPLRLGGKKEYFDGDGITLKGPFGIKIEKFLGKPIQKFVTDSRQIPISRESDRKGTIELKNEIKRRFAIGESILLHAEGTRSIDGRLNKFKYGAASFAIKNSVPIVPVSIMYEKQRFSPRSVAEITFGQPLMPVDYGMEFRHFPFLPNGLVDAATPYVMNQNQRIAKVTDILEQRVAEMSGQERSGYYLHPYTKQLIIPEDEQSR